MENILPVNIETWWQGGADVAFRSNAVVISTIPCIVFNWQNFVHPPSRIQNISIDFVCRMYVWSGRGTGEIYKRMEVVCSMCTGVCISVSIHTWRHMTWYDAYRQRFWAVGHWEIHDSLLAQICKQSEQQHLLPDCCTLQAMRYSRYSEIEKASLRRLQPQGNTPSSF